MELSKYFNSETAEVFRSEIKFSEYNPRVISEEGKKQLKRSIKKYGVVGGIVVNKQTGNTIVGGHQKVGILDELNKFPENDYRLKVEIIDVDEKTEKQLNIVLNNPNIGGEWDYDKLARIIPDIDYKDAGLTDADINMVGLDYLLNTEEENNLVKALDEVMAPVNEQHEAGMEAKKEHMKEVKRQVREQAEEKAENLDAYVVLSFDTFKAKAAFCSRFGYNPYDKIIKGEVFQDQVERID